jgi:hypothetical protein
MIHGRINIKSITYVPFAVSGQKIYCCIMNTNSMGSPVCKVYTCKFLGGYSRLLSP